MAYYDNILAKHGYDPNQDVGYSQGQQLSSRTTNGLYGKSTGGSSDLASVFGNIAKSASNVGGQILGGIGNAIAGTVGTIAKPISHFGGDMLKTYTQGVPAYFDIVSGNRAKQYEARGFSKERAKTLAGLDLSNLSLNEQEKSYHNPFNPLVKEHYTEFVPAALTAASVAAPFLRAPGAVIDAAEAGGGLLPKMKALPTDTVKSIITGNGAAGNSFANPAARFVGNLGYGLGYSSLVTQPTIQSIGAVPGNVNNLVHGKANTEDLMNLGGLLAPAGVTALGAAAKGLKVGAKNLFMDTHGVFDVIKLKNGKTVNENLALLKETNPKQAKTQKNILKVIQDWAQQEHGANAQFVANQLERYQGKSGAFSKQSLKEFTDSFKPLIQNRTASQKIKASDLTHVLNDKGLPTDVKNSNLTIGALSTSDRKVIADRLGSAENPAKELQKLQNEYIIQNQNVYSRVNDMVESGLRGKELSKAVGGMTASRRLQYTGTAVKFNPENGYFLTTASKPTGVIHKASEVAPLVEGRKAPLGFVGNMMNKAGLSPVATPQGQASKMVAQNLEEGLAGTKFMGQGQEIMNKIYTGMDRHKTVVDPRMFTKNELDGILGDLIQNKGEIGIIQKAIKQAYGKLPAELVGLGPKAINKLLAVPGVGNAESKYLRYKGALSFSYNPFFAVKQGTKSAFISFLEGGNPAARMSKDTEEFLRSQGKFNRYLTAGAMNDLMGTTDLGRNAAEGAKVNKFLQGIIGGTAESIARAHGKTVRQIYQEGGPLAKELDNMIQMTVSYPKGGYLQSPLAKTLNTIIFPSRFETKVLSAMGGYFAKRPPAVQISMIKHIADGKQWLDSPQGEQWKKDNAKLIKLVNYFSPTHTVSQFMDFLHSGKVADLGQIGGMPLGFVSQMLKTSGVKLPDFLDQSEHADEETGKTYAQRVGVTDKAKLQLAAQDLLGSLFSYPGQIAGLPSKRSVMEMIPGLKPDMGSTEYIGGDSQGSEGKLRVPSQQPQLRPPSLNIKAPESIHVSPIYKTKTKKAKVPKPRSVPISTLVR